LNNQPFLKLHFVMAEQPNISQILAALGMVFLSKSRCPTAQIANRKSNQLRSVQAAHQRRDSYHHSNQFRNLIKPRIRIQLLLLDPRHTPYHSHPAPGMLI